MSPLFVLLQINDYVATVCGFCLSLTLLIMILTEKNGELRGISRVLIQNCVLDCIFSISCFLTFPQNYTHNGVHYLMVTGFLRGFPNRNLGTMLIYFYVTCLGTSILIIPVPFYMRYLIICRCYVVIFFMILLTIWIMWNAYPANTEHNIEFANFINHTFWVQEFGFVPIFAANYIRTWQVTLVFVWGSLTVFVSYTIVIYLTIQLKRKLRMQTQLTSVCPLSLQIQKVLILQALGPFVTAVIPMAILAIVVLPNFHLDVVLLSCATIFVWISGINAVAALFVVRSFRRRILQNIWPCRNNSVVNVSVLSVT